MTHRQIHPEGKSSIQPSREAHPRSRSHESGLCSKAHHMPNAHQLAPPIDFLYLPVDQAHCHLPPAYVAPPPTHLSPVSKMSGERIEVLLEAITGEERETVGSQELSERMEKQVRRMLGAGSQVEHGHKLGARTNGQPKPEHLCTAAEPCANLV